MIDESRKPKQGPPPWVPISKDLARLFPKDRPFTEIEAVLSLQLDHNNGKAVSVLGYSKLWKWTRDKVSHFISKRCGLEIDYPEDTKRVKKQLGKLKLPAYQPAYNPHIKFIDYRQLHGATHIKPAYQPALLTRKEKEKKDIEKDPRVRVFSQWFCEKYKKKFGEEYLITNHGKHGSQIQSLLKLSLSWEDLQYLTIEFLLDDDSFLGKAGHNIGTLLTRVGQNAYGRFREQDFRDKNLEELIQEPKPARKEQKQFLFKVKPKGNDQTSEPDR